MLHPGYTDVGHWVQKTGMHIEVKHKKVHSVYINFADET